MMVCKNQSIDVSLNSFLKQGFIDHFGNHIFEKWLQNCVYFANKKTLIIKTETEDVAKFINQNLIQDISHFCTISWPKSNIKPIACTDVSKLEQYAFEIPNNHIDNVVSIDEYKGHSFDDFIVNDDNKIAFDSVCSIVGKTEKILQNGTIIFLTGDVGVGKTHLLKSAEQYSSVKKIKNTHYLSAEVFSSKYITAVKENKLFDMRNIIIANDVLLIDDIGFIAHRKSTMEELGSIISIMLDSGKDVIITTTSDISTFKDSKRLYARLLSAVFISISKSNIDLKQKIAIHIAKKYNIDMSSEVINFLANNIIGGTRELKGAIDRIRINLSSIPVITIPAIKNLLSDILLKQGNIIAYNNDIAMIVGSIAEYYQLSNNDILNAKKTANNKLARSMAIYLCREICGLVYAQIAKNFGFSAHASIIHSIASFKEKLKTDKSLVYDLDCITENIRKYINNV